ncbi:phage major tail protein [Escherichia coli]|uniref:Phage major tail protein n=1 Tax=Escherichia coli TaxID=562 RepID=A0A2X3KF13_ECOLX|nr:phage major tail protein [Escherichia coli]
MTAKEVITRTVKVTNVGKPSVAEERSKITPVSAIKVTPTSGTVAKGKTTTLTVSFEPGKCNRQDVQSGFRRSVESHH